MRKRKSSRLTVDPTLTEIRRRCAEIQARWSEREKAKRAGSMPTIWRPPLVAFDETTDTWIAASAHE